MFRGEVQAGARATLVGSMFASFNNVKDELVYAYTLLFVGVNVHTSTRTALIYSSILVAVSRALVETIMFFSLLEGQWLVENRSSLKPR